MKTICKIFELKLKGLHEHLGADCQRVFLSVQLLRSLQAWENKKWRVEFVSARLRKIRYHVLLSVWCQALWVVPECLIPLRLQRRPQMWQRFNQSSRLQPLTGSHFPLFISSVSLFTSYFSPPLSLLPLRLLIKLCNTVLSALTDVSVGLCYSTEPKPNPPGRPRPVPASLRYSARHFVCVFIKSLSICDQEHVFQSTFCRSRVIIRGSRTNYMVSFQIWICSWSHVAHSHRKWQLTFYVSCGWV